VRKFEKTEEARPVTKMNNAAWKAARERAADKWQEQRGGEPAPEGFRRVRVHDLKHTFGRRLRAAGVSFEDRQDLLGHKSGRITTLLPIRTGESHRGSGQDLRDRVPQNSRNHMASPEVERRDRA
jgi:integrase